MAKGSLNALTFVEPPISCITTVVLPCTYQVIPNTFEYPKAWVASQNEADQSKRVRLARFLRAERYPELV